MTMPETTSRRRRHVVARAPNTRLCRRTWPQLLSSARLLGYLPIVSAATRLHKARVDVAVDGEGRRVVQPAMAITPGVLLRVPIMQVRVRRAATRTMTMLETTSRKMPHMATRAQTLSFRCRSRRGIRRSANRHTLYGHNDAAQVESRNKQLEPAPADARGVLGRPCRCNYRRARQARTAHSLGCRLPQSTSAAEGALLCQLAQLPLHRLLPPPQRQAGPAAEHRAAWRRTG